MIIAPIYGPRDEDIKVAEAHQEDLLSLMKSQYPVIPVSTASWMREYYKGSVEGQWSVTKEEGYGYRTVLHIKHCPSLVVTQLHEKAVDALFPKGRPKFLQTLRQELDRMPRKRKRLGTKVRVSSFEPILHPEAQDTDSYLRESALESGYKSIGHFHDGEYLYDKYRDSEYNMYREYDPGSRPSGTLVDGVLQDYTLQYIRWDVRSSFHIGRFFGLIIGV